MKGQVYIVVGTSRNPGNTWIVARALEKHGNFRVLDLQSLEMSYFDYEHKNKDDDFLTVMKGMLTDANAIVFLTPVYWYTMSAIMKTFLDRFSDLLRIEKDLGRQLRGMPMLVISCSESDDAPPHFDQPFLLSARYLGMAYCGYQHVVVKEGNLEDDFLEELNQLVSRIP